MRIDLADLHSYLKKKREQWKGLARLRDQSKYGMDVLKANQKLIRLKHLRFILSRLYILVARAIQWRKSAPNQDLNVATAHRIQDGLNLILHYICGAQRHEFVYELTIMVTFFKHFQQHSI